MWSKNFHVLPVWAKKKGTTYNFSRQATDWEKIFIKISNKALVPRIYEELLHLDNKKINSPVSFLFFLFLFLFRAVPVANGSSQARGQIGAAAASLTTATPTWDLSSICDLHHSSRQ